MKKPLDLTLRSEIIAKNCAAIMLDYPDIFSISRAYYALAVSYEMDEKDIKEFVTHKLLYYSGLQEVIGKYLTTDMLLIDNYFKFISGSADLLSTVIHKIVLQIYMDLDTTSTQQEEINNLITK